MIQYYTPVSRKKIPRDDVPTSVILPIALQEAIARRAALEDRSFSAIIRLALRKELGLPLDETPAPDQQAA
jgi:hypothetical protein